MNINLKLLKETIEQLEKPHQIEIGKIFRNNNISMDENKNGIFINLTSVNNYIINKIQRYLKYVEDQEGSIEEIEDKKQQFKDIFFNNTNGDSLS
tara:strand:- start:228 stop:512 length:285 start_codon:yes stop_codon:yes gene_type:complete